jgi:MFS family permease
MLDAIVDPALRRFLWVRVALSATAIADPFYVVYGLRELAVEPAAIGGFLAALVAARMLTTPLWTAVVRRHGSRTVLQLTGLVRLLVPLIAVLLPYLAETDAYRNRVDDDRITAALFGLTFVAYGIALAGQGVGNFTYLVNAIAPARQANAFAATNVALGLVALLPLLGALVVERTSFETLFLVATVASLTGVFLSGALPDPDVRVRTAATAWRLRRARP